HRVARHEIEHDDAVDVVDVVAFWHDRGQSWRGRSEPVDLRLDPQVASPTTNRIRRLNEETRAPADLDAKGGVGHRNLVGRHPSRDGVSRAENPVLEEVLEYPC